MKLTITNTAQNPTMIFLADKSTRDLAPGQTLKDIEVEDGQAGLRVVRILEAASRSLAQRGRVIELQEARQVA